MANFTNASAFAKHVRDGGAVLQKAQRQAVIVCAQTTKEAFLAAPGAPHIVAGAPTTVGYTIAGTTDHTIATVSWRGPAHLVDKDTSPHLIEAVNRQALKFPDGNVRYSEFHGPMHPGTHGKHFFDKGEVVARSIVPGVYRRQNMAALGRHFG